MKSNKKKLILTITLEIIFAILLIILLVVVKQRAISYLNEIQDQYGDLNSLQEELSTQNLSNYDQQKVTSTLTDIDSKLEKGITLIRYILPISLILLSLIFYFLIWRITSKVKVKRFILSSILPLILLLMSVYFTLNYIAFYFNFSEDSQIIYLIVSIILLIITYYFSLFMLSNNKSLKENLKLAKKSILRLLLPFTITILTNLLFLVGIFILFFLSYIQEQLIVPGLIVLILIILMNLERNYLVNKINS